MNNEIAQNISTIKSMPKQNIKHANSSAKNSSSDDKKKCAINMQDSMDIIGNINRIGIHNSLNKNIASYTAAFLADSDYAQHYNDIYDSLIEQGLTAQQAIEKTDSIMKILKDKNTYIAQ